MTASREAGLLRQWEAAQRTARAALRASDRVASSLAGLEDLEAERVAGNSNMRPTGLCTGSRLYVNARAGESGEACVDDAQGPSAAALRRFAYTRWR